MIVGRLSEEVEEADLSMLPGSRGTGASYNWCRVIPGPSSVDTASASTSYGREAVLARLRREGVPRLDLLILLAVLARNMLPKAPKEPRRVSIPGSSNPAGNFSSAASVFCRAACSNMVDRRSSFFNVVGSTFDICKMVIPIQIMMKAMTIVMIWLAVALRPWKRTCDAV